jgi:hypothetical protein
VLGAQILYPSKDLAVRGIGLVGSLEALDPAALGIEAPSLIGLLPEQFEIDHLTPSTEVAAEPVS